jgi:hypothetical protein
MKAYWDDSGRGPAPDDAKEVNLAEAGLIWTDEVRGVQGNFFGLIDDQDRTIQFYYEEGIPDGVDDASHLRIVRMDFPQPDQEGSYSVLVTIDEVLYYIERAFEMGADYRRFENLEFAPW